MSGFGFNGGSGSIQWAFLIDRDRLFKGGLYLLGALDRILVYSFRINPGFARRAVPTPSSSESPASKS
jgi:hypothetical protein